tara:strand:- start:89 stop:376 length:288 start_codon:yes stop_codon:yes gene_type:complete
MNQAFILLLAPFLALAAIEFTSPPPIDVAGIVCEDQESCKVPPAEPDVAANDEVEKKKKPKKPCAKKIQEQQREIAKELKKIKDQLRSRSKKKKD